MKPTSPGATSSHLRHRRTRSANVERLESRYLLTDFFDGGTLIASIDKVGPVASRTLDVSVHAPVDLNLSFNTDGLNIAVNVNIKRPDQLGSLGTFTDLIFDVALINVQSNEGNDVIDVSKVQTGIPSIIRGGGGADTIIGSSAADEIWGGSGDDELLGHDGNDILYGEDGDDRLWGEGPHLKVRVAGTLRDDQLHGGPGNDRFFFSGKDLGTDTVVELAGEGTNDVLDFKNLDGPENPSTSAALQAVLGAGVTNAIVNDGDLQLTVSAAAAANIEGIVSLSPAPAAPYVTEMRSREFSGGVKQTKVEWNSNSDLSLSSFTLQRSRDGINWQTGPCDTLAPNCEATSSSLVNEFLDDTSGRYFYRILAIDTAGNSSEWSEIPFTESLYFINRTAGDRSDVLLSSVVAGANATISWPDTLYNRTFWHRVSSRIVGGNWSEVDLISPGSNSAQASVPVGESREFRIERLEQTGGLLAEGFINVVNELPVNDNRGAVMLVVDETIALPLAKELSWLAKDLVGDGWQVVRRDVPRHVPSHEIVPAGELTYAQRVAEVKNQILTVHGEYQDSLRAVFLIGHVPVPYSGLGVGLDGHTSSGGAWPADIYYGDVVGGQWTDNGFSTTGPLERASVYLDALNIPGDGKFDQETVDQGRQPELWVGRLDMANLSEFQEQESLDEIELLRRYFDKNHAFRHKTLLNDYSSANRVLMSSSPGGTVVGDWSDLAAVVGPQNVFDRPWRRFLEDADTATEFLFAFGNGFGLEPDVPDGGFGKLEDIFPIAHPQRNAIMTGITYLDVLNTKTLLPTTLFDTNRGHGVLDVTNTFRLARTDVMSRAVFAGFQGSYSGLFDSDNNLLRALLADEGHGLASVWGFSVDAPFRAMGSGATIGQSVWHSQQDPMTTVEAALVGDPTLRAHIVAPPKGLNVSPDGAGVTISWQPPLGEAADRYRIYKITESDGQAELLHDTTNATQTSWFDPTGSLTDGYMVRALKRESVNSGTYWNISQAAFSASAVVVGVETRYDFNGDGVLNILDIDLIHTEIIHNNANANVGIFDLDGDNLVRAEDGIFLVKRIMGLKFGDANLDSLFSSADLVSVFQSEEFEDGIEDNSTWAEGDWNFDGDFTTSDLVFGFQDGYDG